MFAQGSVFIHLKGTQGNFLVGSLTLQGIIVSREVLIGLASFGMLLVVSALRPLEDIMMRCLTRALIALEINLLLQVLTELPESIMCSLEHVSPYFKDMKMKFLRFPSTLKGIR